MQRQRRIVSANAGELNLTAMIDVAFQLLSFFILTSKPIDIIANLDVSRPQLPPEVTNCPKKPLNISVKPEGKYMLNDRSVTLSGLDTVLCEIGKSGSDYTVVLACSQESTHEEMVAVLDLCAKAKLTNLSILSVD